MLRGSIIHRHALREKEAGEDLDRAVHTWARAATERLLLRAGIPPRHWKKYEGRGKAARTLLRQAFSRSPEGAADAPGRRALQVLRNRVRALVGMAHTPHWHSDHGVNTRTRIRCLGTFGMEPAEVQLTQFLDDHSKDIATKIA